MSATLNGVDAPATEEPTHKPYIPDDIRMPEFTWSAVLLGAFLGLVFSASSLYLVLKIGMTVSASIPVAVLAITLFRAFSKAFGMRRATILENNIVQTTGSAGESIAFGVGVTMPALLILGFEMDIARVMVVSLLGGILGILAMIPLRRAFIVKMHGKPGEAGKLLYPEGTACAQVLISGEKGGTTGKTVFIGFGIAFLHKFLTEGMGLLVSTFRLPFTAVNRSAVFAGEMASELLGVGYIIGFRTSAVMMAGALLGYLVIIPLLAFVGDALEVPILPSSQLIRDMGVRELRDNYLLFIGAGCVASAGIISMFRTLPMIVRSIQSGLKTVRAGAGGPTVVRRTENDMSMRVVLLGSLGLIVLLAVFLSTQVPIQAAVAGAILVVVFGFLFVTVSARLTGEIGSSSNPISGMTVATLTLTCLIFLALSWTSSIERVLALSIAAVVCVAASNGGTTAQSLKTGFLVGGTPRLMQWAILIGALTSALVIGFTLVYGFNAAGTVYSEKAENLPKITLTAGELAQIKERKEYNDKEYVVWDSRRDYQFAYPEGVDKDARDKELKAVKHGHYLIEPETGKPAWLVDYTIMGKLDETDKGEKVKREFDAPKTQVMGLIINGVLKRELNWTLVLIGALLAVVLELCGVSSLAFAVGVYVPIQYSTPIFIGGVLRWGIDRYLAARETPPEGAADDAEARAAAEVEAIRKSETSPGVLLAAGYIAGGSLAGVVLAFLSFSPTLPKTLSQWQYGKYELTAAQPFDDVARELAPRYGVGSGQTPKEKEAFEEFKNELAGQNSNVFVEQAPVPKGWTVLLPKEKSLVTENDTTLGEIAKEQQTEAAKLLKLNRDALIPHTVVAQDTEIRLGNYQRHRVKQDTTLGQLAERIPDQDAETLYARNAEILELPARTPGGVMRIDPATQLPAGTTLDLPQKKWPAYLAFGLLALFMFAVGIGKILKPAPDQPNGERAAT